MKFADTFNQSGFACWVNGTSGRVFRICAGLFFLTIGLTFRDNPLGIASMIWSFFPLSAGLFDLCYISAALGGPLSGARIRSQKADL